LFQLALFGLMPACSDDSPKPKAKACNDLVNDAPEVGYTEVAGAAPTPSGGAIVDGRYVISALNLYALTVPVPDSVARGVFAIEGNEMQQVGELDGEETRYTSTFTTSGTSMSI